MTASIVAALMRVNGTAGVGFASALMSSIAALVARSAEDSICMGHFWGKNLTVSRTHLDAVLST